MQSEAPEPVADADLVPLRHPAVADLRVDLTDIGETYSALAGLARSAELELEAIEPHLDRVARDAPVLPTQQPIALIGAPTDVGAGVRGASMGPEALRVAQLVERRPRAVWVVITAVLLVFEMTQDYHLVPALLVATLVSLALLAMLAWGWQHTDRAARSSLARMSGRITRLSTERSTSH